MPPRVLIATPGHPEHVPGGTDIAARDLVRALRATGRAEAALVAGVTRLHREPQGEQLLLAAEGADDEVLLFAGAYDRFLMSRQDAPALQDAWARILRRTRPDIVHLHGLDRLGADIVALIRRLRPRAPIVLTLHDFAPICFNGGLMRRPDDGGLCERASAAACARCFPEHSVERFRMRELHLRNTLLAVDRLLAPSRFLAERFVRWGIPAERIEVVPNAAAAGMPAPEPMPDRRGVFAFFGNLVPHKGILTLLEAIRQARAAGDDVRLEVHGAAPFPEPGFARALADARRDADGVTWHGGYGRNELAARMAGAGWVVVPSTWWENAPLVVLEAFRHGRPVICSGIGGMAELVADGTAGLHVPPGDPVALARTLRRAAGEPELWERLRAGIPPVLDHAAWAERHLGLYARLLAGPRERAIAA
jgi:glycosyltransferase involved in cell wall biosynthesis